MADGIRIDNNTDLSELIAWARSVNQNKLHTATRMAINDTLRWSRTRIGRSIREKYNIKADRINDPNNTNGLRAVLVSAGNTAGKITGGHRPVTLASLIGVSTTKKGISVAIVKGQREQIRSAFMIPKFKGLVFARGLYNKNGFEFRHKRTAPTGQPDKPIDVIRTVSVATAALNARAYKLWEQPVADRYNEQVRRQISRLIGTPGI